MSTGRGVIVIADDVLQRHRLQQALDRHGLPVAFIGDPERFAALDPAPESDLCLVELTDEEEYPELIEALLAEDERPLLFGPGAAPEPGRQEYVRWERRLFAKLEDQLGRLEALENEGSLDALAAQPETRERLPMPNWLEPVGEDEPARELWVLGASLGGPAAVKAFLDALPGRLPIAFVYAQHIDAHFSSVLSRVLTRDSEWHLVNAEQDRTLRCGEILQVPVEQALWLDGDARIQLHEESWSGPYGPSIDQVMTHIARVHGGHCHSIIFSGMGNDGALAAPALNQAGGHVWVQRPDTCASPAMPESVQATGTVDFQGDPRELAARLLRVLEEQTLLTGRSRCHSA
ncbi:chemotaxis protein CheB [Halospina sp. K52047b]|uniref:chemotaxis protein CheB n=1 Tax=Halospina sp. K52047b TaxID=2614160 RepID=UPI00124ABA93|nr:chemotaxis protein CheB [Halospina sp. K52047b]KAA8982862.1 chemotaxis protein CheB [Halospina sp. K52047b]